MLNVTTRWTRKNVRLSSWEKLTAKRLCTVKRCTGSKCWSSKQCVSIVTKLGQRPRNQVRSKLDWLGTNPIKFIWMIMESCQCSDSPFTQLKRPLAMSCTRFPQIHHLKRSFSSIAALVILIMFCICCNVSHEDVSKSSHEEQSQSVKFFTPVQSISVLCKQKLMINHC